jgi:hypothetical protein
MKINTVIAGAQKAGTTSLYDWLGQHPEIFAPEHAKDFHFFSNDEHFTEGISNLHSRYQKYSDEKVVLHAGVNYCYFPEIAYPRIFKYNPEVRVLLSLRNPTQRALSAFNYFKRLTLEKRKLEDSFDLDFERKLTSYEDRSNYTYLDHGFYFSQVKELLSFTSDYKIVFFEDMITSKVDAYKDTLDWLGVDTSFTPLFSHENVSGKVRIQALNKFLWNSRLRRKIKSVLPYQKVVGTSLPHKIFLLLNRFNTDGKVSKETDLALEKRLNSHFRPDVENLSELLNMDLLKKWGFDSA